MDRTKHRLDCERVFKRYDARCPRCQELASGAKPREGWGGRYSGFPNRQSDLEHHFTSEKHRTGGCGPVCTFGDW